MNGREWGHGYSVSTDAGKTEIWLRSLPKVATLLTESGYPVSYSKLWAIQTQRDDLAAGRVNTRPTAENDVVEAPLGIPVPAGSGGWHLR